MMAAKFHFLNTLVLRMRKKKTGNIRINVKYNFTLACLKFQWK